jgi:hypothetical protein
MFVTGPLPRVFLLFPISPGDEQEYREAVTLNVETFLTGTV